MSRRPARPVGRRALAEGLAALLVVAVCALVLQQIATSFAEQGIAGGTPYDDAASYPRAVALLMMGLLGVSFLQRWTAPSGADEPVDWAALARPAALVGFFALYLVGLALVGYSLATPPAFLAMMKVCDARGLARPALVSLGATLGLAILFEEGLNVVLPGGAINWNLHWLW